MPVACPVACTCGGRTFCRCWRVGGLSRKQRACGACQKCEDGCSVPKGREQAVCQRRLLQAQGAGGTARPEKEVRVGTGVGETAAHRDGGGQWDSVSMKVVSPRLGLTLTPGRQESLLTSSLPAPGVSLQGLETRTQCPGGHRGGKRSGVLGRPLLALMCTVVSILRGVGARLTGGRSSSMAVQGQGASESAARVPRASDLRAAAPQGHLVWG